MCPSHPLSSAKTWGWIFGELFDYVNGVCDPLNPFAPGDYGPSGEDIRHRLVLAGTLHVPGGFELTTPYPSGSRATLHHHECWEQRADFRQQLKADFYRAKNRTFLRCVATRGHQIGYGCPITHQTRVYNRRNDGLVEVADESDDGPPVVFFVYLEIFDMRDVLPGASSESTCPVGSYFGLDTTTK